MRQLLTIQQYNNITIEKALATLMLIFAIGFNLWSYRLEPSAKIDPNDNAFQFALVDRTNKIWNFAAKNCLEKNKIIFPVLSHLSFSICHLSFLVDHWVPNWNEGYNLPYYYSHLPQILIVGSWRLLNSTISLFQYYHWIIYLLLSFFPLSIFLALRLVGLPWLTAGIGALLATQISTDGLYGLDPPSFLWRGYGLSSQLFAMIFLPLAIAYSYRWLTDNQSSEGGGRQFLRELAFRSIFFRDDRSAAERHLARRESNLSDRLMLDRASRKNSSANSVHLSSFWPAVFFLFATTAGHLGIGMIAMLSLVPLAIGPSLFSLLQRPSHIVILLYCYIVKKTPENEQQYDNIAIQQLWGNLVKLVALGGAVVFFLSYWVVPIFLADNYHNISFWDPVWKFNSYGAKETMVRLLNGDLFDFGRLPIFTILVFIGAFVSLRPQKSSENSEYSDYQKSQRVRESDVQKLRSSDGSDYLSYPSFPKYFSFALLFLFWLLLYFGRTTWGGLVDLLPGMKEFHLSRFIVGLHLAGLFLAPIGVATLSHLLFSTIQQYINITIVKTKLLYGFIVILLGTGTATLLYPQTISYNDLNNTLIIQANANFDKVKSDVDELFATLRDLPPGRIYAGRAGWGRNFRVAETAYYMHLSTYGFPSVMWMPETWSPNADIEQYFSENKAADYALYNIRYVVAPPKQEAQKFWRLITQRPTWKLYAVDQSPTVTTIYQYNNLTIPSSTYITTGVRPAVVSTTKQNFVNVVRLFIQSDKTHANGLYPELTFDKNYPRKTGLPNFKMLDEVTYQTPDGSFHNLFQEPPVYLPPTTQLLEQFNNLTIQQYNNLKVIEPEEIDSDMVFKVNVKVEKDCPECLVILRQTFHPNWRATIDGKPVTTMTVFPFFVAIPLAQPGNHEVVFTYQPGSLKVALLTFELASLAFLLIGKLFYSKPKLRY